MFERSRTDWVVVFLLCCFVPTPMLGIAQVPACITEEGVGPYSSKTLAPGVLRTIHLTTPDGSQTIFPGPAKGLIRICLKQVSYELKVSSKDHSEAAVVAPGGCMEYEGGRSSGTYVCDADPSVCKSREPKRLSCTVSGTGGAQQRPSNSTHWVLGAWAWRDEWLRGGPEWSPGMLLAGHHRTTLAKLVTAATYEVCAFGGAKLVSEVVVDGTHFPFTDRCMTVEGRTIGLIRKPSQPRGDAYVRSRRID